MEIKNKTKKMIVDRAVKVLRQAAGDACEHIQPYLHCLSRGDSNVSAAYKFGIVATDGDDVDVKFAVDCPLPVAMKVLEALGDEFDDVQWGQLPILIRDDEEGDADVLVGSDAFKAYGHALLDVASEMAVDEILDDLEDDEICDSQLN